MARQPNIRRLQSALACAREAVAAFNLGYINGARIAINQAVARSLATPGGHRTHQLACSIRRVMRGRITGIYEGGEWTADQMGRADA